MPDRRTYRIDDVSSVEDIEATFRADLTIEFEPTESLGKVEALMSKSGEVSYGVEIIDRKYVHVHYGRVQSFDPDAPPTEISLSEQETVPGRRWDRDVATAFSVALCRLVKRKIEREGETNAG